MATTGATTPAEARWPHDGSCDFDARRAQGWTPEPLNEFIFKVQTRCNLNCDYCYVYNMGDDSWRSQPKRMSQAVVEAAVRRIDEHATRHGLTKVLVSLHGGEPLLGGLSPLAEFVAGVRNGLTTTQAEISVQTNGTLVTEEIAAGLAELDVRVGVSLDGPESANAHRLDRRGRPSFQRTERGIRMLQQQPGLLVGVLCVVDLANEPVEVLRYLTSLGIPSADLLLPHGNWVNRPIGKQSSKEASLDGPTPYGDWLICTFDAWASERRPATRIRIFDDIIHLILGGTSAYEALGLGPATLVVIEADGAIELVDHLGPSHDGAEQTGCSVFSHSFDDALRHPGMVCRQIGAAALSPFCVACSEARVCGGGLITHRWHEMAGFLAPTVYCADMYKLIRHIRNAISDRARGLQSEAQLA